MDDSTDINVILNDDVPETPEIEAQPVETIDRPRDEHGRFAPKSETGETEQPAEAAPTDSAPPAQQPEVDPSHIPFAALRDERQKRQQLEAQLQQYEQHFQQLQQPQQYQQPEVPDVFTDPQGYTQWVAEQVEARIMQQVQQYGNQFGTTTRADVSEMLARRQFDDYDQVIEQSFKPAVAANPFLAQQMARDPDPAGFAYKAGKQWAEAQRYGQTAPVSREQIEAEIREKIMAEIGMSSSQTKAPSSLASERSANVPRTGVPWGGPSALDDILR